MEIHSYPKVFGFGHKAIANLFSQPVKLQEKLDGSQFSFMYVAEEGLKMRSKNAIVVPGQGGMFGKATNYLETIATELLENVVYRGEYLQKAKHNILAYDREPTNHIVIYDLEISPNDFQNKEELCHKEAERLGFEYIQSFGTHMITSAEQFLDLIEKSTSMLGGPIEGIVAKNYNMFGMDGKVLMGKYVSEKFKEKHAEEWGALNPSRKDILASLILELTTEARWRKAIIHAREEGWLQNEPKDIGPLIKSIQVDVDEEEAEYIKDKLYNHFKQDILRGTIRGFPEWYKNELLEKQFSKED